MNHHDKVVELHLGSGMAVDLKLAAELVNEEARELVEALGFVVNKRGVVVSGGERMPDAAIVKECCDNHVVVSGVMHMLGLNGRDAEVCQEIVDDNNLLKIATSPGKSATGKLLKAADHPKCEPLIAEYLDGMEELALESDGNITDANITGDGDITE